MRAGVAPIEDEELEAWMAGADLDGTNTLSFFEYVRMDTRLSLSDLSTASLTRESTRRTSRSSPSTTSRSAPPVMLAASRSAPLTSRSAPMTSRSATPVMMAVHNEPTKAAENNTLGVLLGTLLVSPLVEAFDKSGLDRGDFRWEFLVPWLGEADELTQLEEITVGATFIVAALALQVVVDPENAISDHLSYICFFLSYAVGNKVGFRLIAIMASALEIFSHLVEKPQGVADIVPVTYNVLFLIINTYYALRRQLAKQRLVFTDVNETLYRKAFEPLGIRRSQFRQLMSFAEPHVVGEEAGAQVVFTEGAALTDLYVSLDGNMDVVKGGVPVATLEPYQLIGEVALLENIDQRGLSEFPARATLVAEPGAHYLSWAQTSWYSLMKKDAEFAYATQLMISRTLSRKLGKAREEQGMMCDTAFSLFDQDRSGSIDATELRSALRALGNNLEAAAAAEMIRKYDTNGNGSIDLQGFRALARDLPELVDGPRGILVD